MRASIANPARGNRRPPSLDLFCDATPKGVNIVVRSRKLDGETIMSQTANESNRPGRNSGKRKQYSAPALEKGLDILELLAKESYGLNISQLAARLGRSVGEIFRMVAVLEQRGYLHSREGSDAYVVTLKLFQLAHLIPPIARVESASASILKNLAHAIGQSCHVVIYYDGLGHVVVQQDAPSERILSVRLGAQAPLLHTCSGHVLLAFASEEEQTRMVGEIPKGRGRPKRPELTKLTARIRGQGYETMKSAQVQGVQDIGFPVFDHTHEIAAALVVPFLAYLDNSHPIDFETAKHHAATAAESISMALGYSPREPVNHGQSTGE